MEHQVNHDGDVDVVLILVPPSQKNHGGLEVDDKDIIVNYNFPVFHPGHGKVSSPGGLQSVKPLRKLHLLERIERCLKTVHWSPLENLERALCRPYLIPHFYIGTEKFFINTGHSTQLKILQQRIHAFEKAGRKTIKRRWLRNNFSGLGTQ